MSEEAVTEIKLEHLLAGAIHAAGGELKFTMDDIMAEENYDKFVRLVIEDGNVTVTLVESEEE